MVPTFVTHYYLPERTPFLSLSDLSEDDAAVTMADLMRQRDEGLQHRLFGPRYRAMRHLVEERLYRGFIQAGGRPERKYPHYFVLGESAWFRGLAVEMREVRVPLASLPDAQTSFTYPDSFTAMRVAPEFGLPYEHRSYHGRVFRLGELRALIEEHGLPAADADDDYMGYERRTGESYIEVQLWSDLPIKTYLAHRVGQQG